MTVEEHPPLTDVKNQLSEVVDRVEREHRRVVITKRGRPAVVLLNVDDLASLEETLGVMGNRSLMGGIREALDDIERDR